MSKKVPLALVPVLGSNLVGWWLEYLVSKGAREVILLASDRPEMVREFVGDGARWGMKIRVIAEKKESRLDEARSRYGKGHGPHSLSSIEVAVFLDHFPGRKHQCLLESCDAWQDEIQALLRTGKLPMAIGMKEIRAGVHVSCHATISPSARLEAPCWVGPGARIEDEVKVGPESIIEEEAWLDSHSEVANSIIGPCTFVGAGLEIRDSFAWGNSLTHLKRGTSVNISDPFLLTCLESKPLKKTGPGFLGRFFAFLAMTAIAPLAMCLVLRAKWQGRPALSSRLAVRWKYQDPSDSETIIYYELNSSSEWLKRWPQLWQVIAGEFTWVGNRPLSPVEVTTLANEFEQLWLASPIGLMSHGEALGCFDLVSDEARSHASYYSVCANWKMDMKIAWKWMIRFFSWRTRRAPIT